MDIRFRPQKTRKSNRDQGFTGFYFIGANWGTKGINLYFV